MSSHSKIEWCDATWQVASGCSPVSGGCRNCYSARLAHTRLKHLPQPERLIDPLRWRRPRRIFVCDRGDLFHPEMPQTHIDQVFAVMALCPQHLFLLLTKRPGRMREYIGEMKPWSPRVNSIREAGAAFQAFAANKTRGISFPLPNVWLGVSVEDQATADERIPSLLATPAAGRFISAEPLLGQLDLQDLPWPPGWTRPIDDVSDGIDGLLYCGPQGRGLDWVIVGGESGPGARPMHPAWARAIRDQCAAAGTPFFFKQWGEWLPDFEDPPHPIEDGPEQSRFPTCVWDASTNKWERTNGCWDDEESWVIATDYWQPEQSMRRVGKKRAGRRLDGVTHDALPPLPITSPLAGEVATPKLSRSEGRAGEGNRR